MFWRTAGSSPLPTALNESQKYCHVHHTWLVGAAVTISSLSTMCHQKCCKSHLSNNSFFVFICLFQQAIQCNRGTAGRCADQYQFLRPLHSQYGQFRGVYSGQYLTLDSWSNALFFCGSKQSKRLMANLDPLSPIAAEICLHVPHLSSRFIFV